ncbi:MAG: FAD:protein FMN transferase [Planctomycetes bacterium]|nr:FAD:protein FMN transferase [Planctomycetota bacterium]
MKKIIIGSIITVLAVGWFMLAQGGDKPNPDKPESAVKRTKFLMDTYCTIQVPGTPATVDKIINAAFDRMEEIDRKFNILNPASPLYRFNNEGAPITDTEIINIITIAQEISKESGGAFDITVEPLVKLWGFFSDNPHLPQKADIENALKKVGYQHIIIKDGQVTKDLPDLHIDLGAIAKGYGLSETVKVLKNQGAKAALIEAGGQVYGFGAIKGKPWMVGIRNPRSSGVIAGMGIADLSISTSGDYERFFEQDGIRYHHILDPQTGYPARGLMSLSVLMQDPTLADGWSTALFVMGPEKAMKLAQSKSDIQIIVVNDRGEISSSAGLDSSLKR